MLAAWVAEPGAGPVLEFEGLLKVFLADNGSRDELLRTLGQVRAQVHLRMLRNVDVARSVLDRRTPFPPRDAVNQLVGTFLIDFDETVNRWAEWATGVVAAWPGRPVDAQPDLDAVEDALGRTLERIELWRASGAAQVEYPRCSAVARTRLAMPWPPWTVATSTAAEKTLATSDGSSPRAWRSTASARRSAGSAKRSW